VVEKRRAARRFNDLLLGGSRAADGRTERRRRRLLEELAEGVARRGKRALKPVDVLARVDELLALGEPLASIRKVCPPPPLIEMTPEVAEVLRQLHSAYRFSEEAYRFVGLDLGALRKAGLAEPGPAVAAVRPGAPRARRGAA
jgi:hypothetical protein